ncbi:YbaY family lipoprotein [Dechloromonas sp. XY25]|uniref:YbaY family lipoprotein n=1 Tax=Dechloromonas hankyongensis TaxID=2908002 RepID=A0ABS9K1M1_9RHOO|nr:YbaY family lipoprotein [Dechloromonas hankyongensis]MCG2577064.1 YbaY family lipoprotein [Dechloromonas hankyongensis]
MKIRYLLPLLCALSAHAAEDRQPYTCDNGNRLDISFTADADGRPQATLHFADETMVLPMVPSPAGTLYRRGDIRLHTQDDVAIFEDGKSNRRRCLHGNAPPPAPAAARPAPPAAASSFIDISGSVTYPARIALPPDAILTLRVRSGGRTLAEQRYELNGAQVPIPFSTTLDRDLLGKQANATVSARIDHRGKLRLVSDKPYPVLHNGQPVPAEIVLKPFSPTAR